MSPDPNDGSSTQNSRISLPPVRLARNTIEKYEVIYPLGQGGMASVHVGRLSGMAGFEKLVAIKVVHPHLMNERAFLEMFLDEARLAAQIRHPNVAEIYSLGEEQGLYYMIGELVLGQNLRAVLRRCEDLRRPLGFGQMAHIAADVARGLHAAHDARGQDGEHLGLVHRDVSPRNVLISYTGHIKLIDFGVAWAKGKLSHTRAGAIKGKMAYMPPEQLRGFPLDRRSDIYSLGVVLYSMVTGSHPFPGKSQAERMTRIVAGEFEMPRAVRPEIPPELERIILEAMSFAAEDRFATADEMAEELETFARSTGEPAGAGALGKQMNGLFTDEIARHDQLMRSHREERQDAPPAPSAPAPASPVDLEVCSDPTDPDADATRAGTPRAMATHHRDKPRSWRLALAVTSAAAVLLGGAVYFGLIARPGKPPTEQTTVDTAASTVPVLPEASAPQPVPTTPPDSPVSAPGQLTVRLTGLPESGAVVSVDGRMVEVKDGQFAFSADSAEHMLEIEAPGYLKRSLVFRANEDSVINATLRRDGSTVGKTRPPRDASSNSAKLPEKKGNLRRNPYQ